MSLTTLNQIFFAAADRNLDRAMLHRQEGKWRSISSSDFHRNVAATAHALQQWGIHKGDRVAILSENRPEWSTADFAILLLGAITVPVYATLTRNKPRTHCATPAPALSSSLPSINFAKSKPFCP